METKVSRRSFLRGAVESQSYNAMRPPGALLDTFEQACQDCSICQSECPENIIEMDEAGRPRLNFAEGSCSFCGACAEACPTDALSLIRMEHWPWRAQIDATCLSRNAVSCRLCQDSCEAGAIRFQLRTGGCADPIITLDRCTGCGACSHVCPSQSVQFFSADLQVQVQGDVA